MPHADPPPSNAPRHASAQRCRTRWSLIKCTKSSRTTLMDTNRIFESIDHVNARCVFKKQQDCTKRYYSYISACTIATIVHTKANYNTCTCTVSNPSPPPPPPHPKYTCCALNSSCTNAEVVAPVTTDTRLPEIADTQPVYTQESTAPKQPLHSWPNTHQRRCVHCPLPPQPTPLHSTLSHCRAGGQPAAPAFPLNIHSAAGSARCAERGAAEAASAARGSVHRNSVRRRVRLPPVMILHYYRSFH